MLWGTRSELETKRRISLLIYAYAYEFEHDSLVDDHTFDKLCLEIDLSVSTGNPRMDSWFSQHFQPCTGMWIQKLPEGDLKKIRKLYLNYYKRKGT